MILAAFWLLAGASAARAYESEYADENQKIRLRWKTNTINLTLSNSLRQNAQNIKTGSDAAGAVRRSLQTWETAANVKFNVVWTDKTSISRSDSGGDALNLITVAATAENSEPFADQTGEMPGRTRLFYNARGKITEADIVLNPFQQFSTDGTFGTYDLEAALTHEIGHLLGLAHSDVLAATMYAQQGKNGMFSLPAAAPRTLAEDDRAGARAVYGARTGDDVCCGAIAGTIFSTENKPLADWQIWAEDPLTGRIAASVHTSQTGNFQFGALPAKNYRLLAQPQNREFSAETVGEAAVENNKTIQFSRKLTLRPAHFEPLFVGYNAQLSTLAVPLGANGSERWQTIFLAGNRLDKQKIRDKSFDSDVSISSQSLTVVPSSLVKQDFETALPVYSFNLRVQANALAGEYSVRWQQRSGESIYLLGCLSLEAE